MSAMVSRRKLFQLLLSAYGLADGSYRLASKPTEVKISRVTFVGREKPMKVKLLQSAPTEVK
jgi:hypothetical protein